jgi:hypothetical protein
VCYWLEKAEESLASAHREFEAGSFSFAMNRLYYAAFYAVSALLMEHDRSFKNILVFVPPFTNNSLKPAFLIRNGADSMINFSKTGRKEIMWSSSPLRRIMWSPS